MLRLGLIACLGGCGAFEDKPYLIEDLRVVAVVADPPEIHPGEQAVLTAYVADPRQESVDTAWSYCGHRGASENARACSGDAAIPLETDRLERIATGVYVSDTSHTVSPEAVAEVPQVILEAGFWEHVRLRANQPSSEIEALKRLVVVAPTQAKNRNPELAGVVVRRDGTPLPAPLSASPEARLELTPMLNTSDFEPYRVLGADGTWQDRHEEPVITWYTTGGELDPWVTRGDQAVRWTLPERDDAPAVLALFAVLRDGRGGSAVWVGEVELD